MSSLKLGLGAALAGALCLAATPSNASVVITDWYAASGLPSATSPAWTLFGSPANVSLAGGAMVIKGKTYYGQSNLTTPPIDTLNGFSIEARARFDSGSHSLDSRDTLNLSFTLGPNIGNALFIGDGRFFINSGDVTRGATMTGIDTRSFHTYRVDVSAPGKNGLSTISVFYDGVFAISGSTFSSASANGIHQRVDFGGGSIYATGTSEWQFVRNTPPVLSAVPEPATWTTMIAGLGIAGLALRRRARRPLAERLALV